MNNGRRKQRRTKSRDDYRVIANKLNDIANKSTAKATWRQQVLAMGPDGRTDEERVAVWRAMKDAGAATKAEAFFAIYFYLETKAIDHAMEDPTLNAISERMREVEREHDLPEDCFFTPGEEPDEYKPLLAQWNARNTKLIAEYMREHGDAEMADLLLNDRLSFDRIHEAGRQSFFGTWRERAKNSDDPDHPGLKMEAMLKEQGVLDDQGRPIPVPGFED